MKTVNLAKEFSRYPAGRYTEDGPYSGQAFREQFLEKHFKKNEDLTIILDGARGYGSSFLEEAFGGMVRRGYSADVLIKHLKFISKDPTLIMEIKDYIANAKDPSNA